MNEFDLQAELNRNESDKQIVNAELEVSRKKWVDYLLQNKENICSYNQPIKVKKKNRARFNDFVNKIKIIFGLKRKENKVDGIETYLQYCNSIE